MQQHLPDELWIDVLSFLPLADLSAGGVTENSCQYTIWRLLDCDRFEALQLAIDHKLLTKETKIELRIDNNLPTIKWLYERDILQPDLSK
ncbi:hypothetical protein PROFUN_16064 [Planoprotostelium fungivorum]|uniref:F-box domain-containing protein n=1 Tax=Planoprotostelium fungivorum TaxID=1890364 RepID=A0A2P6MS83_9EUKA|nr:hypothetical protein PROFUN_16064 [Planoprotostelium fungivorum]